VGHTVTGRLVSDPHPWHIPQPVSSFRKNLVAAVASRPEVTRMCVTWPGPSATQPVRVGLTERAAPRPDRLVADHDTTGHHHLLDLTETERKAVIQPHTVTDDLHREAIALYNDDEAASTRP
jgi:hypothetical protein